MRTKHSSSTNKPLNQVSSLQPYHLLLLILYIQNNAHFSVISACLREYIFSQCNVCLSIYFLKPQSHSFGTTPLNTSGQDRYPSGQRVSF